MTMLATLEQAKTRLRITDEVDDADLTLMLQSASAAVLNYLKVESLDALAVGDPLAVPERITDTVMQATLLLTGYYVKDRDNDAEHEWEPGFLPRPVTALLYPLRDPALA